MFQKLNPKDIPYLDPSSISFVTLKDGTIIYTDETVPPKYSSNGNGQNNKDDHVEPNQTLTNMESLIENEKEDKVNYLLFNKSKRKKDINNDSNNKQNFVKAYTNKNILNNIGNETSANKITTSKNSRNKILYSSSLLDNKENKENKIISSITNKENNNLNSIENDPISLRRHTYIFHNNNKINNNNFFTSSSSNRGIKTINSEISLNIKGKNAKKPKNDIIDHFNHLLKGINEKKIKKNSETYYVTKYKNYKLNNISKNSLSSTNLILAYNNNDKPIQYMNENDAKFSENHHIKDNKSFNELVNNLSIKTERRGRKYTFRNMKNKNKEKDLKNEIGKFKRNSTFISIYNQSKSSGGHRLVSPVNKISSYKLK